MTSRTRIIAVAAMAATFCSANALAQESPELALNQYQPPVAGDDFLAVPQADVGGHLLPHAQLIFDYAKDPFVLVDRDGERIASPVTGQIFLHVGASLSLWDRLLVSASFPVALMQTGDDTSIGTATIAGGGGAASGDLRFGVRGRIFGERGDAFQVGAGGWLFAPSASGPYSGDGSFYGEPHVLVNGRVADMFLYSASLGAVVKASDNPSTFTYRAAVGVLFLDDKLLVGPETYGSVNFGDGTFFEGSTTPIARSGDVNAELLGSIQYRLPLDFVVGAGAGPGLADGVGSPQVRVLGRVMWDPQPEPPPEGPPDSDEDGIPDAQDACPDVPGVASDDPTTHGCPPDEDGDGILDRDDACPTVAGVPSDDPDQHGCPPPGDSDGDGITDDVDACPQTAGIASPDPDRNGCPPPDGDGDGIPDAQDACPRVPGVANADPQKNGCPPDTDGDGIADPQDACPKEQGIAHRDPEKNGCPRVRVTDKEVIILQKVEFDLDRATIKAVSNPVLDEVAQTLRDHPELRRLEVQGHTDDKGPAGYNQRLSQKRAESVRRALIARGVEAKRLTAKGYGESEPLTANDTEEGRAKNRRVQFKILERKR